MIPLYLIAFIILFIACLISCIVAVIVGVYYRDTLYNAIVEDTTQVAIQVQDTPVVETMTTNAPIVTNMVIAFDKENYGNKLTSFAPGKFVLVNKGDNSISSLKIPAGYEVHLYDDANFKKELAVYKADIPIIPPTVNKKASSIHIKKINA